MQALNVVEMLEHYFQIKLDEGRKQRVENAVSGGGIELTPAEVDQFTVEHDEIERLIPALGNFISSV